MFPQGNPYTRESQHLVTTLKLSQKQNGITKVGKVHLDLQDSPRTLTRRRRHSDACWGNSKQTSENLNIVPHCCMELVTNYILLIVI